MWKPTRLFEPWVSFRVEPLLFSTHRCSGWTESWENLSTSPTTTCMTQMTISPSLMWSVGNAAPSPLRCINLKWGHYYFCDLCSYWTNSDPQVKWSQYAYYKATPREAFSVPQRRGILRNSSTTTAPPPNVLALDTRNNESPYAFLGVTAIDGIPFKAYQPGSLDNTVDVIRGLAQNMSDNDVVVYPCSSASDESSTTRYFGSRPDSLPDFHITWACLCGIREIPGKSIHGQTSIIHKLPSFRADWKCLPNAFSLRLLWQATWPIIMYDQATTLPKLWEGTWINISLMSYFPNRGSYL